MELITEQPLWYLLFCLLLGAVYAFILYRKDSLLTDAPLWLKRTMIGLRFITVSFLSFLLLSPLFKISVSEIEKPIIVIAQDNSESLLIGKDSAFYKHEYTAQVNNLVKKLGDKYEVKTFSFGDKVSEGINFNYTEKQTNVSQLFDEIYNKFSNRNVGAIVLASDGLYNQGSNPLYAADKLKLPIYTIALGDTNIQKDIVLKKVLHNKIAFLGNVFPLELTIDAKQCKGLSTAVTVEKDSLVLFRKVLAIGSNTFHAIVPLTLEAKVKGMQHYKVRVAEVTGEISKTNNIKDIYIEVLENKQKILILADAPHPDIAAIKQSIESNQSYEVKSMLTEKFDGLANKYNLVILHQLPSKTNPITAILEKLKASGTSVLYIVGSNSSIPLLNKAGTGITILGDQNKTNEVLATVSQDFSIFTVSDDLRNAVSSWPPLLAPFGTYKQNANGYPLLKQQVGSVKTDMPLLSFSDEGNSKTGVLSGEGIWKWRLRNFAEKNNHDAVNELITKTVQYLSVKEEKGHFRVIGKNNFMENEPVMFDAEVYNDSYELVNTSEVKINIQNKNRKSFPFTFSKTEKAYTLNAGYLPAGMYSYQATAKAGDKVYTSKGIFSISPLQVEFSETEADHHLLYSLAKKFDGAMLFPIEMDKLFKILNEREDIKPLSYSQKRLNEVINLKLIFFLLLLLLSAEWFLRKRNGGY